LCCPDNVLKLFDTGNVKEFNNKTEEEIIKPNLIVS